MSTQVLISCFVSCWLSVLAVLTAPASAEQIEQPAIRDTAYPIPPDAVFVAPNGKDRNPGTKRAPLLTIGAAMELAPSGGTIVIRRGTYRESLPDLAKPLTFQPYPHEKVWLKGSIPVTGWVREGKFWRKDGWSPGFCRDCYHPDNIDPQYPNAGQPDQVFVDGTPLKQVSSRKELGPGTFLVDDKTTRLYIAIRPTGRLVEASVHGTALTVWQNGKGSVIRGLGFAHYAPVATHGAAATLKLSADDIRFENNTVAWSSVKGLEVFGRNAMIRGNTFIHNGWIGLAAWKAHDLTVTGNRFAHNNREMFVRTGHIAGAAGASITNTKHALVSDNLFDSNRSNGLWFDQNVTQATVVRNIMRNNLRHGLFYEISSHGLIASNIISNSGLAGIAISDSAHQRIYNNTLFGNALGLVVQDGDRINDDAREIAAGNTWISADTRFQNNLISGTDVSTYPYIWVRDFTGLATAGEMLSVSDTNGFYRRTNGRPSDLVEWWNGKTRLTFKSIKSYAAATGRDRNSFAIDNDAEDPFHTNAPSGNFALKSGSVARHAGQPLPEGVARAIGVMRQKTPNLGALLLPGGHPVTPD